MQRVLSFPMARGFGETSEFVSKRMCFSFLLSVGFLCLLFGFLLGRFATERAVQFRAERKRLELAGNGLGSTEYLQHSLLQEFEGASFDADLTTNGEFMDLRDSYINQLNNTFSNLSLFHTVKEYKSCFTATVRGSREPDRYVILSAQGEGVSIAVALAKALNKIHEEHNWKTRRTLIFCISFNSSDYCPEILPGFVRRKIVAYVTVDNDAFQGGGHFIVSGSHIVQSMVLQAANVVQNLYPHDDWFLSPRNWTYNDITISRLTLDVPHAVLSFANDSIAHNHNDRGKGIRKVILAQILSQTIWRLSECLIMKWDPNYFNDTVSKVLESVRGTEIWDTKEKIKGALAKLVANVEDLNGKIDATESTNTLDVRILNDLLMDLDRALLCPDDTIRSKTNWAIFMKLSHEPSNIILMYLNETAKCYEIAIQILQDW